MTQQYLLLGEVAAMLGQKPHRVNYALISGYVKEPRLRIGNKRIFQSDDVRRLANHFGVALDGVDEQKKKSKVAAD